MMRRSINLLTVIHRTLITITGVLFSLNLSAQQQDSVLNNASLEEIVQYAITHQPAYQQSQLDRKITDKQIAGRLADWYPQINFLANYQHNFIIQQVVTPTSVLRFGVNNSSSTQLNATQNLFNRDVILASQTASNVRLQSEHSASRSKLDLQVTTTKAFYDLLRTIQQIRIGEEDITRLKRSLRDAESRYKAGIADKTDYKRAMILLQNATAILTTNKEALAYKKDFLKANIGYPPSQDLTIRYDTMQMENEISLDTLEALNYNSNVDYRILYITRELQKANVTYNKMAYVPQLNLFGSYIINFQNNQLGELYKSKYPYVYGGATFTMPIFQGNKRNYRVQEQKYALKRADLELSKLRNNLNTEYTRSLAAYKSSLATYQALKDNVVLAKEVYDVIQLQYSNGVRPYLDVTVAETDLQTARINYFNALYSVLASKMDVLRAKGETTNN
jgi:outer membrane protein TolC